MFLTLYRKWDVDDDMTWGRVLIIQEVVKLCHITLAPLKVNDDYFATCLFMWKINADSSQPPLANQCQPTSTCDQPGPTLIPMVIFSTCFILPIQTQPDCIHLFTVLHDIIMRNHLPLL